MLLKMVALIFINPLTHILVGMIYLVFTKKYKQAIAIILTLYFYIFSISITSGLITNVWGIADTYKPQEHYDAVTVLAGVLDVSWYESNASLFYVPKNYIKTTNNTDRILAGLYFLKSGQASELLLGEWIYNCINEAQMVKMYLSSQGISQDRIVLYSKVDRTIDEARGVRLYARKNQIKKILLVTSSLHMRRAFAMFKNQGLTPDTFSTNRCRRSDISWTSFLPSVNGISASLDCIYELTAYVFYYAKGDLLP